MKQLKFLIAFLIVGLLAAVLIGGVAAALESEEVAKLKASAAAEGDRLGGSAAVSGDTAVVGAPASDPTPHDPAGDEHVQHNSGAAYVFVRNVDGTGTVTWPEQQKLIPSDPGADVFNGITSFRDGFGISVAISGDSIVIGAPGKTVVVVDETGNDVEETFAGAAYVFVRSGGIWLEQQKLTASDADFQDGFGSSVAISGDTALIGATDANDFDGAAYVFVRIGGAWSQQAKLAAFDAFEDDQFGGSVAISGDTAVIGAKLDEDAGLDREFDSGSAYVFVRSVDGSGNVTWPLQQKIKAGDPDEKDRFGGSVAVSGDTAVIGARDDDGGGTDSGAAYVFVRSGGTWTRLPKLVAGDAVAGDRFGGSVAVSGDKAVVGAHLNDDVATSSGAAYVFVRSIVDGTWSEQKKLTANNAALGDTFGRPVALSGDTTVIGATGDDDVATSSGAAYVFVLTSTEAALCTPGSYSVTGAEPCTDADAGSFVASSGATGQTQCAAGSFSDTTGATICTQADAGSFVASTGATGQTQCAAGSFSDTTGATICTQADAGSFVASTGATGQTQCAAGSFSDTTGATICTDADAGSFVASTGATGQTACLAGTFSATSGASSCTDADPGSFVAGTGATGQTQCAAGSFSDTTGGATICTQADAGSFVASSGATGQTACLAGSFSDTTGATICTQADAGSFVANVPRPMR